MIERGSRYIVTTKDNMYITPSARVIEERGKRIVRIAVPNGGEYTVLNLNALEILSIYREIYTSEDVTNELIPMDENFTLAV